MLLIDQLTIVHKRGICPHIIASCIEHVSVLSPLQQLVHDGVIGT